MPLGRWFGGRREDRPWAVQRFRMGSMARLGLALRAKLTVGQDGCAFLKRRAQTKFTHGSFSNTAVHFALVFQGTSSRNQLFQGAPFGRYTHTNGPWCHMRNQLQRSIGASRRLLSGTASAGASSPELCSTLASSNVR